jgi:hypothetical protein
MGGGDFGGGFGGKGSRPGGGGRGRQTSTNRPGLTLLELIPASPSVLVLMAISMAINVYYRMLDVRRTNVEGARPRGPPSHCRRLAPAVQDVPLDLSGLEAAAGMSGASTVLAAASSGQLGDIAEGLGGGGGFGAGSGAGGTEGTGGTGATQPSTGTGQGGQGSGGGSGASGAGGRSGSGGAGAGGGASSPSGSGSSAVTSASGEEEAATTAAPVSTVKLYGSAGSASISAGCRESIKTRP